MIGVGIEHRSIVGGAGPAIRCVAPGHAGRPAAPHINDRSELKLGHGRPLLKDRRDEDAERQTRSLAGLAVVLALAVAALFLVQHLKREGEIEDCLMAGRSNCDALIQL
jgi:hypothetical protein